MSDTNSAPGYIKIVAIIAIIWNAMGVLAFIGRLMLPLEELAATEAERELIANTPVWVMIAFAFAVFGGTIGSIFLLLKKRIAFEILLASMIGILVQMFYNFFLVNSIEVYGPGGMIMPIMVILIGAYLIYLANTGKTNGWLS